MSKVEVFSPGTPVWTCDDEIFTGMKYDQLWSKEAKFIKGRVIKVHLNEEGTMYTIHDPASGDIVSRPHNVVFERFDAAKAELNSFLERMEERIKSLKV